MKIWAKTKEFFEGKFLVVRRDSTVPHWPHFVLGARDPWASAALEAYADAVEKSGGDHEYIMSVRELAADFREYHLRYGEGDPWAGPHRKDNQAVIYAMRGDASVILVTPDKKD